MNATGTRGAVHAGRARDSLNGLALGDAFGETWFRISAGEAERRQLTRDVPAGPWPWTDDTVMALSLYQVLITQGEVRQDDLARAFADAYSADPYRGYGGSMHDVLRCIGAGEDWRAVTTRQFGGMGSWGNGAAMRVAPAGRVARRGPGLGGGAGGVVGRRIRSGLWRVTSTRMACRRRGEPVLRARSAHQRTNVRMPHYMDRSTHPLPPLVGTFPDAMPPGPA